MPEKYATIHRRKWRQDPENRAKDRAANQKSYSKHRTERLAKERIRNRERRADNPELYRARDIARYEKHKEKRKAAMRARYAADKTIWQREAMKRYGLTLEQFNDMVSAQENKCAACGLSGTNCQYKRLVIDHNHDTKAVRALLCDACNRTIGHAKEDRRRLILCARYLKAHQ